MGLSPSVLTILPHRRVTVDFKPAATVYDMQPLVNIAPFGLCQAPANPAVAAATAAAFGVPTPAPCVPATASPWSPGSPTVTVGGQVLLGTSSSLQCSWGGTITLTGSGAQRTSGS